MQIYSIGHSSITIERFVDLLRSAGIVTVVDVRSSPYSKFAPQFNRELLMRSVQDSGLRYVYLGTELGGRPKGEKYYDAEGKVLYGEYRLSEIFQQGIANLLMMAQNEQLAIACSEENPAVCHRKLLVGRHLLEQSVGMLHIRGDGRIQTDAEVDAESSNSDDSQLALFNTSETVEWKSILSVSPKKPPSNSLKS